MDRTFIVDLVLRIQELKSTLKRVCLRQCPPNSRFPPAIQNSATFVLSRLRWLLRSPLNLRPGQYEESRIVIVPHVQGSKNLVHCRYDNSCLRVSSSIWSGELTLFLSQKPPSAGQQIEADQSHCRNSLANSDAGIGCLLSRCHSDFATRTAQHSTRTLSTCVRPCERSLLTRYTRAKPSASLGYRKLRRTALKFVPNPITVISIALATTSWLPKWTRSVLAVCNAQYACGRSVTADFD
jgi:hypothetical protein